jgi:hypothetical protein
MEFKVWPERQTAPQGRLILDGMRGEYRNPKGAFWLITLPPLVD